MYRHPYHFAIRLLICQGPSRFFQQVQLETISENLAQVFDRLLAKNQTLLFSIRKRVKMEVRRISPSILCESKISLFSEKYIGTIHIVRTMQARRIVWWRHGLLTLIQYQWNKQTLDRNSCAVNYEPSTISIHVQHQQQVEKGENRCWCKWILRSFNNHGRDGYQISAGTCRQSCTLGTKSR